MKIQKTKINKFYSLITKLEELHNQLGCFVIIYKFLIKMFLLKKVKKTKFNADSGSVYLLLKMAP